MKLIGMAVVGLMCTIAGCEDSRVPALEEREAERAKSAEETKLAPARLAAVPR